MPPPLSSVPANSGQPSPSTGAAPNHTPPPSSASKRPPHPRPHLRFTQRAPEVHPHWQPMAPPPSSSSSRPSPSNQVSLELAATSTGFAAASSSPASPSFLLETAGNSSSPVNSEYVIVFFLQWPLPPQWSTASLRRHGYRLHLIILNYA
uniref:Uncharacterized protein n=1 Tax=Oryza sativa subsp. japonica TaxID=39947 RepID=Q5Z886_ORYSJ|nr:hypothetical protein [Oryza sativa Japonica Group]BAD61758.1 hypothetical protein [Oryza sativa Japonica Group]